MPAYPQVAVTLVERSFEDGLVDVLEVDALLEEMLARPAWQRDAACTREPVATFFPTRGQSSAPARVVCARCPVLAECRAWALEQGPELQGVWAGLSEQQRRQVNAGAPIPPLVVVAAASDRHGTVSCYRRGCRCQECRAAKAAETRARAAEKPSPADRDLEYIRELRAQREAEEREQETYDRELAREIEAMLDGRIPRLDSSAWQPTFDLD